jgi:replication factor A1
MTYDEIVKKIKEEKNLTDREIQDKVNEKLRKLSNLISKEGAAHILANELGIKLIDFSKKIFKIKDLIVGVRGIDVTGKIIQKFDTRGYKTEKREGRVATLRLGDETGSIRVVIWEDKLINKIEAIEEGSVIKINNITVRDNNGLKEIHLTGYSDIGLSDEKIENVALTLNFNSKKIKDLTENDFASILGTIVQLFEPRFYEACPECNKKLNIEGDKFVCSEHGTVKEKLVPIVNIFLDDGTENIRVVAFRDIASKILNLKEEELLKIRGDPLKFEDIKKEILGRQIKINGKANRNEMFDRLEFTANSVEEVNAVEIANQLLR